MIADKSRSTHSTIATHWFYGISDICPFSTPFNTFQQISTEDSAFSTIYYYFFYIFNKYISYKVLYISHLTHIVECWKRWSTLWLFKYIFVFFLWGVYMLTHVLYSCGFPEAADGPLHRKFTLRWWCAYPADSISGAKLILSLDKQGYTSRLEKSPHADGSICRSSLAINLTKALRMHRK